MQGVLLMSYQKICPQCKTLAPLEAERCLRCGHVYRTRFTPPEQTRRLPAAAPATAIAQAHGGKMPLPPAAVPLRDRRVFTVAVWLAVAATAACLIWGGVVAALVWVERLSAAPTAAPTQPAASTSAADWRMAVVPVIGRQSNGAIAKGTGFFISQEGLLITAHHVVADAWSMDAIYGDRGHTALYLAGSQGDDLALLKVRDPIPGWLPLARADEQCIGRNVSIIGYPGESTFQIQPSQYRCTVRSIGYDPFNRRTLLTLTAIPSKGASGSPIILSDTGQVVGVLYAAMWSNCESAGVGVPISVIRQFLATNGR
jgi:S1-C subfamily serine protease